MDIAMARGDLEIRKFDLMAVNEHGEKVPYTEQMDDIFFTVKTNANTQSYLIQKRLSDAGIISLGNGSYQFRIEPEDTDNLAFGNYFFDIEVYKEDEIKKTFTGTLMLTKEATWASNEGATG